MAKNRNVFTSPDDSLILEDDSGRIRLGNPADQPAVIDVQKIASGMDDRIYNMNHAKCIGIGKWSTFESAYA